MGKFVGVLADVHNIANFLNFKSQQQMTAYFSANYNFKIK